MTDDENYEAEKHIEAQKHIGDITCFVDEMIKNYIRKDMIQFIHLDAFREASTYGLWRAIKQWSDERTLPRADISDTVYDHFKFWVHFHIDIHIQRMYEKRTFDFVNSKCDDIYGKL